MAADAPLTIAIVKPCCIGDCVMALPAIESLAAAFPFAHIHAFTGRHSAPVFRASEHVSRVYITPDQLSASRVAGMAWNLRTAGHDWIVVLDRSRWVKSAARAAAPSRLITVSGGSDATDHEIDVYLNAVRSAGVTISSTVPRIVPSDEARESASHALNGVDSEYAVLHPGGAENPGTTMPDKRWPVERFAAIAGQLAKRGIRPVLSGGSSDRALCEELMSMAPESKCLNLAGSLDLMSSAAVVEKARVYLGADTGISHLAAAVGTPSVVIFGPTNPLRYAPRGERVAILAPEASIHVPDVDLRKKAFAPNLPSTSEVTVERVSSAIDRALTTYRDQGS